MSLIDHASRIALTAFLHHSGKLAERAEFHRGYNRVWLSPVGLARSESVKTAQMWRIEAVVVEREGYLLEK